MSSNLVEGLFGSSYTDGVSNNLTGLSDGLLGTSIPSNVTIQSGSNPTGEWIQFYNDDELVMMIQTAEISHAGTAAWYNLPTNFPDEFWSAGWSTDAGYDYISVSGREDGRAYLRSYRSYDGAGSASVGLFTFIWTPGQGS